MVGTKARRSGLGWVVRLSSLAGVVGLLAGAGIAWLYWDQVVLHPGPEVDRRYILGVISEESPVYFRDGSTRLGVFFADEHRDQVEWEDLPRAWVAGIVAAEDDEFWRHPGVDVLHLAGAMVHNVMAGHVVAGGSTLTQQTAKNIYYRPDRSLRAKLVEGLYALRLEAHYSKQDILTFYANQFHVAGNGRGLGIAARHFFDKDVSALTTVEAAFLAGLVKAPSYYDPFGGDDARRDQAVARALDRTRYVLRRMVEEPAEKLAGPLPGPDAGEQRQFAERVERVRAIQAEASAALAGEVKLDFKKGTFRFDSSAVLDEVARRLAEPPFVEVLRAAGIDDPARAGLRVITTLDADAQRAAVYGLWHHLTEVGVMLEGRTAADFVRADERPPHAEAGDRIVPWDFRLARVVGPADDGGKRVLDLDLGGATCRVDRDGLVRIAAAIHRAKLKSSTAKVSGAEVDALAAELPVDAVVWASVREVRDGGVLCDLELRPELQGGAIVLDHGEIRAMVGGNDNKNFNRVGALRQMGSTWKSLVIDAALELGWSPTDHLDNRRNVFPFSTTFYYPRPDHSPTPDVSLAWAAATSENLASVWLLYHLTDRLTAEQVGELARALGLARGDHEAAEEYRQRVQKLGVLPTPARVEEAWFLQARQEIVASPSALAHPGDAAALASVLYGWGFDAERRGTSDATRQEALDNAWVHLRTLRDRCVDEYRLLAEGWAAGELVAGGMVPDLRLRVEDGQARVACGRAPETYVAVGLEAGLAPHDLPSLVPLGDVLVDGRLHLATLDLLRSGIERRSLERELAGGAIDLYDPSVLYWHQDFRVLLALRYVRQLAARVGVQTPLRDTLSLPLGASEVTLEEITKAYEGLATGQAWRFPGVAVGRSGTTQVPPPLATALLIREIRDVDDRVIYRAEPVADPPSAPEVPVMMSEILRQVVDWGTGRRGKGTVTLGKAALPIGGKTGTTNDFRNAAFVGYVPAVADGVIERSASWALGVYVGYDDNRPMVSGGIKLAGASGALPAWLYTARGLAEAGLLGDPASVAPTGGWRAADPPGCDRVRVDTSTGLPTGGEGAELLVRRAAPPVVLEAPVAEVRPVRVAPTTADAGRRKGDGGLWGPFKKKQAEDKPQPQP
ncbi:MAG TPA: transglycosylase domain-containing protein [Myxococcota bacterium]|nr:transglycosylase domain-containing protein [Myxococcota bacterium]